MSKRIPISFKETTQDTQLYIVLCNLEDRSTVIKDILRKHFKKEIKLLEGK